MGEEEEDEEEEEEGKWCVIASYSVS